LHLFQPLNNSPEKRKTNSLENKNSYRKLNWPGLLLGHAWKLAHGPLYRLQQSGAVLAVECDPTDQRTPR
jgi:hypothetical protein